MAARSRRPCEVPYEACSETISPTPCSASVRPGRQCVRSQNGPKTIHVDGRRGLGHERSSGSAAGPIDNVLVPLGMDGKGRTLTNLHCDFGSMLVEAIGVNQDRGFAMMSCVLTCEVGAAGRMKSCCKEVPIPNSRCLSEACRDTSFMFQANNFPSRRSSLQFGLLPRLERCNGVIEPSE